MARRVEWSVLINAAGIVAFIALLAFNVFYQGHLTVDSPHASMGEFNVPYDVKGGTVYVTSRQSLIANTALAVFAVGILCRVAWEYLFKKKTPPADYSAH